MLSVSALWRTGPAAFCSSVNRSWRSLSAYSPPRSFFTRKAQTSSRSTARRLTARNSVLRKVFAKMSSASRTGSPSAKSGFAAMLWFTPMTSASSAARAATSMKRASASSSAQVAR
ncbi:PP118 [Orf virus]|uniref:PP118 n=1 Tax=Orf virus TaxID=10258 RepID=F1AWX1_ORFV|nr:PP118 [Orf virus]